MDSEARRKIMGGAQLRRLRTTLGLSQSAMAAELGISASYLNLVERNQRPVTAQLLIRLAETYEIDARDFSGAEDTRLAAELEEVLSDPLLAPLAVPKGEIRAALEQAPTLVAALRRLHAAWADAPPPADGAEGPDRGGPAPADAVERVRDALQAAQNHFPMLEAAAEAIAGGEPMGWDAAVARLSDRHGTRVAVLPSREMGVTLRHYDRHRRRLMLSELMPPESRRFQALVQLAAFEAGAAVDESLAAAGLADGPARRLGRVALLNYAAAALAMPYVPFLALAQEGGCDVDLLAGRFGAGWEQAAHRLTTLARPGARGIPFFMVRVDLAGNVSKRFSSGAFPFARAGGTCPRWALHEAFRHPGRVLAQLVETPDGKRWFTFARTVRRVMVPFGEPEAEFAVALGCEERFAGALVYARGLPGARPTAIGPACRLCPRPSCPNRSAPSRLAPLEVSEVTRGLSPFGD